LSARRWIGISILCVTVLPLSGCETTSAPVSERLVSDYRKAAKPPDAPAKPPVAAASKPTTSPASGTAPPAVAKSAGTPMPSTAKSAAAPASEAGATVETATEADWRPESYTVKRGDTLYSIALDHGLDYKDLAAWNQLEDPNLIKVGQQLRLRAPPGWKPDAGEPEGVIAVPVSAEQPIESKPLEAPPPPPLKSAPKGIKAPYSEQALAQLTREPSKMPALETKPVPPDLKPAPRPAASAPSPPPGPAPAPAPVATGVPQKAPSPPPPPAASARAANDANAPDTQESLQWVWPTTGKLLHAFNQGPNPKGVAIGGSTGQAVVASAAGKVVYSGSGLRGYGKLIIIKHNSTYLSVYAHNRELLVKEGERVGKGQKIAEMGSTDSERVGLHFEIRRLGKPVDPLKYLPPEGA
jgi:lipoprotein NlpD